MNNTYEDTEKETTISTKWKNPPTLADLKQNYEDVKIEQDTQVSKIDNWLNYLNITGNVKLKRYLGILMYNQRLYVGMLNGDTLL